MQIHRNEGLLARLKVSGKAPLELVDQRHQYLSKIDGRELDCEALLAWTVLVLYELLAWNGAGFAVRSYQAALVGGTHCPAHL